jgi:hypothetical protein
MVYADCSHFTGIGALWQGIKKEGRCRWSAKPAMVDEDKENNPVTNGPD